MGTISDCWHLKVNLKKKIYLYVTSITHRCPNKIIKTFLIEEFYHLPPVSTTPVVHFELPISPRIFEKIQNGLNRILRALGETDSCKNSEVKNLLTLSLSGMNFFLYACHLLCPCSTECLLTRWMHVEFLSKSGDIYKLKNVSHLFNFFVFVWKFRNFLTVSKEELNLMFFVIHDEFFKRKIFKTC